MKRIKAVTLFILIISVVFSSCSGDRPPAKLHSADDKGYIPCVAEQLDIEVSSGQAFVYDIESGEFLYKKGEKTVVYPASTTKLLTILYALELLSPDEIVAPSNELELVAKDSSIAFIKTYHRLSVEMLIEGMMLPSGNDAAYVLAAAAGRKLTDDKSIDGKEAVRLFVDGMNNYAREIGLCGSHFTSPDGYYTDAHYTTIEDIALISLLACRNEIIMKYAGMQYDDVVYASGHSNHWTNTNLMLDKDSIYYSAYVTGLKTGSAGAGNYSLICTFELDGGKRKYIIGLFASETKEDRYRDAKKVIDYLEGSRQVNNMH